MSWGYGEHVSHQAASACTRLDRCLFAHMPPLHPFRCFCHFDPPEGFPTSSLRRCRSDRLCISLTIQRFGDRRACPAPWSLKCEHQRAEPVPVRDTALHSTRLLQGLTSIFECKRLRSAIVRARTAQPWHQNGPTGRGSVPASGSKSTRCSRPRSASQAQTQATGQRHPGWASEGCCGEDRPPSRLAGLHLGKFAMHIIWTIIIGFIAGVIANIVRAKPTFH